MQLDVWYNLQQYPEIYYYNDNETYYLYFDNELISQYIYLSR